MAKSVFKQQSIRLIEQAVKLDSKKCYSEALRHYQDGIERLLSDLSRAPDSKCRDAYRKKIDEYLTRAEVLKTVLANAAASREGYREQVLINEGDTGFSYARIFNRCLSEGDVDMVVMEDPYIRSKHQLMNLAAFTDVFLASPCDVKLFHLITAQDGEPGKQSSQNSQLERLKQNLAPHGVKFTWEYRSSLHDRVTKFSNGWVVKIGRGLDIYQRLPEPPAPGYSNQDLRSCKETRIDIFHQKDIKTGDSK